MSGLELGLFTFFTENLNIPESWANGLIGLSVVLLWIIFGIIASKILKIIILKSFGFKKMASRGLTIASLTISMVKVAIWFIVIMGILSAFNVDLTPFIASAGVLGLIIGLGTQETIRDILSGLFIIMDGKFDVDEIVEVEGFKGKVVSIGLRTTILENWKGERKIINNGRIESVINYSKNDSVALIDFGVSYGTDLSKLNAIIKPFLVEMKEKYPILLEEPKFLGVIELADSSINLRIIAKTESMQYFQVERDIRRDLVIYCKKNDIDIPLPQVVVHNAKI